MLNIRKAEAADVPAMLEIYNDEVLHGTATLDLRPKPLDDRMQWFRAHNVDNHPLLVAETERGIAGYVSLSPYREKEAYAGTVELSIYVQRGCRGQGVASAMMKAILAWAQSDRPRTRWCPSSPAAMRPARGCTSGSGSVTAAPSARLG